MTQPALREDTLVEAFAPHRILLAERDDWREGRLAVLGGAVLVARAHQHGDVIMTVGESDEVLDLLDGEARLHYRSEAPGAMWLSAPRSTPVPPWMLDALRLAPATEWDWMSIEELPAEEVDRPIERLEAHARLARRRGGPAPARARQPDLDGRSARRGRGRLVRSDRQGQAGRRRRRPAGPG
ncbi:hypothetical protein [Salana multivorans]